MRTSIARNLFVFFNLSATDLYAHLLRLSAAGGSKLFTSNETGGSFQDGFKALLG
jgi:hypothetical protein